jgi:hypothetical protein
MTPLLNTPSKLFDACKGQIRISTRASSTNMKTYPDDRVWNAWVDTRRTQENADVLVLTGDEHDETGEADYRGEDVAQRALASAVSDVANADGGDCGEGVGWHG